MGGVGADWPAGTLKAWLVRPCDVARKEEGVGSGVQGASWTVGNSGLCDIRSHLCGGDSSAHPIQKLTEGSAFLDPI